MKKILVVDDSQNQLERTVAELQGKYEVETAQTVDEAKRYLDDRDYAVVISDLDLENNGGYVGNDVIAYAKQTNPAAKVLGVTGGDPNKFTTEADLRMRKPSNDGAYAGLVRELLEPSIDDRVRNLSQDEQNTLSHFKLLVNCADALFSQEHLRGQIGDYLAKADEFGINTKAAYDLIMEHKPHLANDEALATAFFVIRNKPEEFSEDHYKTIDETFIKYYGMS